MTGIATAVVVMLGSLLATASSAAAVDQAIQQLPTSVTAFIGVAGKPNPEFAGLGLPLNSFNDFTVGFPSASSEMTSSVRSFFFMGGAEMSVYPANSNSAADLIAGINTTSVPVNGKQPANSLVVPALSTLVDDDYYRVAISMNSQAATLPAMAILDLPQQVVQTAMATKSTAGPVEVAETLSRMLPQPGSAALYTSALVDPDYGVVPAAGPVAGLFATSDEMSGVWADPAGDALSLNGYAAQWLPTTDEQGETSPLGLNSFIVSPNTQNLQLWGARTLNPLNSDTRYIGEERLAQNISASVTKGLEWVAFEPAGPHLWAQVRSSVDGFMAGLAQQGAFATVSSESPNSFFTIINTTNNSVADIQAGIVHLDVSYQSLAQLQTITQHLTLQARPGF